MVTLAAVDSARPAAGKTIDVSADPARSAIATPR
jgi:hypothetical protein